MAFRFAVLAVFLSPYLPSVLPLLSVIGVLSVLIWAVGLLVYSSDKKMAFKSSGSNGGLTLLKSARFHESNIPIGLPLTTDGFNRKTFTATLRSSLLSPSNKAEFVESFVQPASQMAKTLNSFIHMVIQREILVPAQRIISCAVKRDSQAEANRIPFYRHYSLGTGQGLLQKPNAPVASNRNSRLLDSPKRDSPALKPLAMPKSPVFSPLSPSFDAIHTASPRTAPLSTASPSQGSSYTSFKQSLLGPFKTLLHDSDIQSFANLLAECITEQRNSRIHERVWIEVLQIIQNHIRVYRKVRNEILAEIHELRCLKMQANRRRPSDTVALDGQQCNTPSKSPSQGLGDDLPAPHQVPLSPQRHLDDFNDFTAGQTNPSVSALPLDELNEQIALRISSLGLMHPAISPSSSSRLYSEQETDYLRLQFDKTLDAMAKYAALDASATKQSTSGTHKSPAKSSGANNLFFIPPASSPSTKLVHLLSTPSRLMRLAARETIVCQLIAPLIGKYAQPPVVNQIIIDQSQKRIIELQAVKSFHNQLESCFCLFPPVFLLDTGKRGQQKEQQRMFHLSSKGAYAHMSASESLRYYEPLLKYTKKATSQIDLNAVKHGIVRELNIRKHGLAVTVTDANTAMPGLSGTLSSNNFSVSGVTDGQQHGNDSRTSISDDQRSPSPVHTNLQLPNASMANNSLGSTTEDDQRFQKSLEFLKIKFDKRLSALTSNSASNEYTQRAAKTLLSGLNPGYIDGASAASMGGLIPGSPKSNSFIAHSNNSQFAVSSTPVSQPAKTLFAPAFLTTPTKSFINNGDKSDFRDDLQQSNHQTASSTSNEITLDSVLKEYAVAYEDSVSRMQLGQSLTEAATKYATSTTNLLHYFLDFIEKNQDSYTLTNRSDKSVDSTSSSRVTNISGGTMMTYLQFWLATDKYRRLLWRIADNSSVLQPNIQKSLPLTQPDKLETIPASDLSTTVHERLRKEALKMYKAFLSPRVSSLSPQSDGSDHKLEEALSNEPPIKLEEQILNQFQSYIAPLQGKPWSPANNTGYLAPLNAQKAIQVQLNVAFKVFLHSESYFEWMSQREKVKLAHRDRIDISNRTNSGLTTMVNLSGTQVSNIPSLPSAALSSNTAPLVPISNAQFGPVTQLGGVMGTMSSSLLTTASGTVSAAGDTLHRITSRLPFSDHRSFVLNSTQQQETLLTTDELKMREIRQSALLMFLVREIRSIAAEICKKHDPRSRDSYIGPKRPVKKASMTSQSLTSNSTANVIAGHDQELHRTLTTSPKFTRETIAGHDDNSVMQGSVEPQEAVYSIPEDTPYLLTNPSLTHGVSTSNVLTNEAATIMQPRTAQQHAAYHQLFMDDDPDVFHAPGELLLTTTKLQHIKEEIDRVMSQIDCIELVIWYILRNSSESDQYQSLKSADNTGGTQHHYVVLKLLDQSKSALYMEIGDLTRLKAKYESHEQKKAIVPGQCIVKIQRAQNAKAARESGQIGSNSGGVVDYETVGVEELPSGRRGSKSNVRGYKVMYYVIQIERVDQKTGWTVLRRYNDFLSLHRKLRDIYPIVNEFEMPGKGLGLFTRAKHDEFKRARMKQLEKYLQMLIDNPNICKSDLVRDFLSSTYRMSSRKMMLGDSVGDAATGGFFRRDTSRVSNSINRTASNATSMVINQVMQGPANTIRRQSQNFAMTLSRLKRNKPNEGNLTGNASSQISHLIDGITGGNKMKGKMKISSGNPKKGRIKSFLTGGSNPAGDTSATNQQRYKWIRRSSSKRLSIIPDNHNSGDDFEGRPSFDIADMDDDQVDGEEQQDLSDIGKDEETEDAAVDDHQTDEEDEYVLDDDEDDEADCDLESSGEPLATDANDPKSVVTGPETAIISPDAAVKGTEEVAVEKKSKGRGANTPMRKKAIVRHTATTDATSDLYGANGRKEDVSEDNGEDEVQCSQDEQNEIAWGETLTSDEDDLDDEMDDEEDCDDKEDGYDGDKGEDSKSPKLTLAESCESTAGKMKSTSDGANQNVGQYNELDDRQLQNLSDPLCFLLMDIFEFKEQKNFWLRRNTSSMLLMDCFGITDSLEHKLSMWLSSFLKDDFLSSLIEDYFMEMFPSALDSTNSNDTQSQGIPGYLKLLQMDASLLNNSTMTNREGSRQKAKSKLLAAWPDVFNHHLGNEATSDGLTLIFEMMQNATMNKHLLYSIFDSILAIVLDELSVAEK